MTTQQGNLLDVLKKKMRQTKDEMERYREEAEEAQRKLHLEILRREEVSSSLLLNGADRSLAVIIIIVYALYPTPFVGVRKAREIRESELKGGFGAGTK